MQLHETASLRMDSESGTCAAGSRPLRTVARTSCNFLSRAFVVAAVVASNSLLTRAHPNGATKTTCWSRFKPPPAPYFATDLNGVALPDVCFLKPGPHHVFVIGDWGGLLDNASAAPKPADHRSAQFPAHHRRFVRGIDDSAQQQVAEQMKRRSLKSRPSYILNVGDNFYWGGITAKCGRPAFQEQEETGQWGKIFDDIYRGPGLDGLQWLGVLGNHDYGGFKFTMAWDQAIAHTWVGGTDNWVVPAQYWSVKVHYLDFSVDYYFLDSNIFDAFDPHEHMAHNICGLLHNPPGASCGPQGPLSLCDCPKWFAKLWETQGKWLEDLLPKSDADWQILVTHFPPEYGKKYWIHLARKHGVDLFISGHRHTQEVHAPGAEGNFLNSTAWIVSGGGGGVTSEGVPNAEGEDDQYGFMDLTLSKDNILIQAISHGGQVRHAHSALKRDPDPTFRERMNWKRELKECHSVGDHSNAQNTQDKIFLGMVEVPQRGVSEQAQIGESEGLGGSDGDQAGPARTALLERKGSTLAIAGVQAADNVLARKRGLVQWAPSGSTHDSLLASSFFSSV